MSEFSELISPICQASAIAWYEPTYNYDGYASIVHHQYRCCLRQYSTWISSQIPFLAPAPFPKDQRTQLIGSGFLCVISPGHPAFPEHGLQAFHEEMSVF